MDKLEKEKNKRIERVKRGMLKEKMKKYVQREKME